MPLVSFPDEAPMTSVITSSVLDALLHPTSTFMIIYDYSNFKMPRSQAFEAIYVSFSPKETAAKLLPTPSLVTFNGNHQGQRSYFLAVSGRK